MIVIPALDLRGGVCLQAADPATAPGLPASDDPVEIARAWDRLGFRRLHVMEREGIARHGGHRDVVLELMADVPLIFQVGGAVSSGDQVERLLDDGASFIVLGARALAEPDWLEGTAFSFPQQLIVAARLHERHVDGDGPHRQRLVSDLVEELAAVPLAGILLAPDYASHGITDDYLPILEDAVDASEHPIFVAGGVHTIPALRALQDRGIAGVIAGASLYSGALDARQVAEEFGA